MHFCVELEECCKNLFKPSKGNQSVEKLFWDVFDLVYHDSKHNRYKKYSLSQNNAFSKIECEIKMPLGLNECFEPNLFNVWTKHYEK